MKRINTKAFSTGLRERLRASGYFQKELADELGLHEKVLSRKLHGNANAHLTGQEVKNIITALAKWRAITTLEEALHLLEQAQLPPDSISDQEWHAPPLSQLEGNSALRQTRTDYTLPYLQRHNLPAPLTRLVGREKAVKQLLQLLGQDEVRLITLFGPGGSGKTRLAQHVANELASAFTHGVWFVDLSAERDPTLVPQSISQALNFKPTPEVSAVQSLITYLQNKHMLLVLDNFEQLEEAATVVGQLLAAAPDLKVLVTSRAVLHLYGETEFNVPPLDVPDSSAVSDIAKLEQYGAVQLFTERARAVSPDFTLTPANASCIAQICERVDGLPLALELAAARVKSFPLERLLARLTEAPLAVLTGGARNLPVRHHTLRDTITWSYNLLSPNEQELFVRLSVFSGGWSLEAAEAMMRALIASQPLHQAQGNTPLPESTFDLLESLVDNSLLVRLPAVNEQMRFTLLQTLREYALERLQKSGEFERLRDWHACYHLGVAEAAEIGLRGPQQLVWQAQLVADRDNFRAALEWSLQQARTGNGMMTGAPYRLEPGQASEAWNPAATSSNKTGQPARVPEPRPLAVTVALRLPLPSGHTGNGRATCLKDGAGLTPPLPSACGRC